MKREIESDSGLENVTGFIKAGCYKCNGHWFDCPSYYDMRKQIKEEINEE